MFESLITAVMVVCQLCGVILLSMIILRGTKIGERFEQWIRSNKRPANVFVLLSFLGIVISLFRSIFC